MKKIKLLVCILLMFSLVGCTNVSDETGSKTITSVKKIESKARHFSHRLGETTSSIFHNMEETMGYIAY